MVCAAQKEISMDDELKQKIDNLDPEERKAVRMIDQLPRDEQLLVLDLLNELLEEGDSDEKVQV